MTLIINLTLLTTAFVGAIAAFGGETWLKTNDPLLRRVTRRGWIGLGCLFASLCVGVTKEIINDRVLQDSNAKTNIAEGRLAESRRLLELVVLSIKPAPQFRDQVRS